jgi:hypothetical protein
MNVRPGSQRELELNIARQNHANAMREKEIQKKQEHREFLIRIWTLVAAAVGALAAVVGVVLQCLQG